MHGEMTNGTRKIIPEKRDRTSDDVVPDERIDAPARKRHDDSDDASGNRDHEKPDADAQKALVFK